MESGTKTIAALQQDLQLIKAFTFRMALRRLGDEWYVHTLMLDTFPELQDWHPPSFNFDYGPLRLISGEISGSDVVRWIVNKVGELSFDGGLKLTFHLPTLQADLPWIREPSHHYSDFGPYPLPYTRYDLAGRYPDAVSSDVQNLEAGFLLAPNCDFFPNARAAILRLMYGIDDWEQQPGLQTPVSLVVRLATNEAGLNRITISPTVIKVDVGGAKAPGTRLIITGKGNPLYDETLTKRSAMQCPLPEGIPTPLWVVLARGKEWIDYYERDSRFPMQRPASSNVIYDPGDVTAEIETLINQGEGLEVEFKRQYSGEGERIKRAVSAFANTSGGTVVIGVDNDTTEVVGITGSAAKLKDDLMRMIRDNIAPMPTISMYEARINNHTVVALRVEMTAEHPCGVQPSDPHYYQAIS